MATVKPFANFNAMADADRLKKAVTGPGTDEDSIIDIVANRTNKQLQEVQKVYLDKFKEGCQWRLFQDFAEPIEWNIKLLISSRMKTLPERDAEYLQLALFGAGTDEMALIEIFGTRTREELKAIYPYFTTKERFHSFLKDDIAESAFLTLLEYFMDPPIKEQPLDSDVEFLRDPNMRKRIQLDRLSQLFASRNLQRMGDVFRELEKKGVKIEEFVKVPDGVSFNADDRLYYDALTACILMAKNIHHYFAQRLFYAVHGPGTDDIQLIRAIASRCEVDMVQIKEEFKKSYRMTLEAAVKDDTSGDFRKCLLMLID